MPTSTPRRAPDASCRVVVLAGKELFIRTEHTAALRRALEAGHGEVDVVMFDGERDQPADVLDECRSMGLMVSHKLVVVDKAEQMVKEAARPLFERYAQAPADGATLVLRAETWRPGNLDKAIERVGVIVKCDPPDDATAAKWCRARCQQKHGAPITAEAARLLVARLGPDLGRLDGELAKLSISGKEVTPDLVDAMVGGTRELNPWEVQADLLSGDPERAVARVRTVLESAPRDAHVPVSIACCQLAAKLHGMTAGLAAGGDPTELAKLYKLWGPSRDAVLRVARRLDPARTRAILHIALEADAAGKSGLGTPARTLEILAARFAAEVSPR